MMSSINIVYGPLQSFLKSAADEFEHVRAANNRRVRTLAELALLNDQFEQGKKDCVGMVIARDERNQLIGGIKLFARHCSFEGRGYCLGGMGDVFTAIAYQHQGIATRMLAKAMLELKNLHADVAYLCTDIEKLETLYWPFGFRHLSQGHTYQGASGKKYTEFDGMLAPVNSNELFTLLMENPNPLDIGEGNW